LERSALLLFLVVLVPMGIYWASHSFEPPEENLGRFWGEVQALQPVPVPVPELELEREPTPEPEPEPEPEPVRPAKVKAPEPTPPAVEDRTARARRLFEEGNFLGSARAYREIDERGYSLARFGVALSEAFPPSLPSGPYLKVSTSAGGRFEGYAEEKDGLLRFTSATGKSFSIPVNLVTSRTEVPREEASAEAAERIRREGAAADSGQQLFVHIQEALRIDRPDLAAPLLEQALAIDAEKPYLISTLRQRIRDDSLRGPVFRALAACMVEPEESTLSKAPVARAPKRLGNGQKRNITRPISPNRTSIRSTEARDLVRKAGPLRAEAEKLRDRTYKAGLDGAQLDDIDRGIELLDEAMELYEKALEHGDEEEIHALLRACSRKAYQLRMWREQVAGR
jgi:tetratricopeptide (TPR) repeat protein